MKRTPMSERKTPLKPGKPLERTVASGVSPTSRSKLHAESVERRQQQRRPRHTGPSRTVLRLLADRSEGLCEFWQCLDEAHHTHHRRPRRMGGSSDPDTNQASNLLRLCLPHHEWVERSRTKALELGLLLHAGAIPLRAPVLLRYGTVLLDNVGRWVAAEGKR